MDQQPNTDFGTVYVTVEGPKHYRILAKRPNGGNITVKGWQFKCCGIATMEGFAGSHNVAENLPDFFAALYSAAKDGWQPWNFIYVLSDSQLSSQLHLVLVENGSIETDVFDNLAHGPNKLHMFRFNLKNVVGKYITGCGFAIKPKEVAIKKEEKVIYY